ncbi:MAG: large conductance mechanosensitive channel protein MscL [Acidimicrobiia bacterium]|nr:large conductance mechanosensitive channel protein MscL [Acidimicrobiia bacterium]
MLKEFKEFINRGSVLDLAVGFIMGVAFSAVVTSFVNDIIMAIVGAIVGKPTFNDLTLEIGSGVVYYGKFLTALINFLIIAFVMYLVVKGFNKMREKDEKEPELSEKDVLVEIRDLMQQQRQG